MLISAWEHMKRQYWQKYKSNFYTYFESGFVAWEGAGKYLEL